jgi:hypothetical protein
MNQSSHHPAIIDLAGEISMDSISISLASPFHSSTILDTSPNKSLPHDVRDAMSEMLKESSGKLFEFYSSKIVFISVDYCKKFERLTRMHREIASPTSTTKLSAIGQGQGIIDID